MVEDLLDVVVVGAGAAGLAAARQLSAKRLRVEEIEARDRIGGRIHTLRPYSSPLPIEAGAEFVHGEPQETWSIIRAAGLAAYQIEERHHALIEGRLQPLQQASDWEQIFSRLDHLKRDDLSFAEFLERHCRDISATTKAQAIAYVEGFNAADSNVVSARWIGQSEQAIAGERSYRIHDGYDRVVQFMAAGIDPATTRIRLNTLVSKVNWRPGRVELQASPEAGGAKLSLAARCALITVPLGVLQLAPGSRGAVEFMPDLPQKRAAWSQLRMGGVVKVVLRFRKPFWESRAPDDLVFLHAPDQPLVTWWTTRPMQSAILTGWSGGAQTDALRDLDAGGILDHALDALSHIFTLSRAEIAAVLDAWHVFDWRAEEFSRGAYAYVPFGADAAPEQLADPVADTLFFAGEATDRRQMGTVAGAIASGDRAARQILQSRPGAQVG